MHPVIITFGSVINYLRNLTQPQNAKDKVPHAAAINELIS